MEREPLTASTIRVECTEGVACVVLDRPPVNAFTPSMFGQLRAVLEGISDDPEVRAVILTGAGKHFCAGSDIGGFLDQSASDAADELARIRLAFNALQDCAVPVIAAVNGAALGAGMVLAALSDIRIASENATFALPEIAVGAMGGFRHAMRVAPQGLGRLMVFTGCRIDAQEALRAGMVERVVAGDDLMTAAKDIAAQIASRSPQVMRLAKKAANRVEVMNLKEGYEYECGLIAALRNNPEAREATIAFIEKRPPRFGTPT